MASERSRTGLIVDGILTTNGMTICTALGATAVVLAEPAPALDISDLVIKSAIPLVAAIVVKLVSTWVEVRAHKAKLRLEAEMKQDGGVGGGS